jgi:N-acetyl sugar amidotransferase
MRLGRSFLSSRPFQVCRRCVMDTTDPDISFDSSGVCNKCSQYFSRNKHALYKRGHSELQWERYVRAIKENSKRRKYDCVLGVSGGVDSSYSAYLCKKYGLRTLLVHFDNGWNTEIASQNIRSLVDNLGFDYYCNVADWEEFREIQLAFMNALSVDLEMTTDIAIHATVYEAASKYGIKYIISGGNLSSEGMLPLTWGYHRYKDMRMYRYIVNTYGRVRLNKTPTIGLIKEAYLRFFQGIKTLYILNYHSYDKDDARNFLESNFGWKNYGGKHHESRITAYWQGYVMLEKFGLDYRKPTLSAQICNNHISREEALDILRHPPSRLTSPLDDSEYIAKKYNISLDELQQMLDQETKCYKDFPNNKIIIDACYNFYNKFLNSKRV